MGGASASEGGCWVLCVGVPWLLDGAERAVPTLGSAAGTGHRALWFPCVPGSLSISVLCLLCMTVCTWVIVFACLCACVFASLHFCVSGLFGGLYHIPAENVSV